MGCTGRIYQNTQQVLKPDWQLDLVWRYLTYCCAFGLWNTWNLGYSEGFGTPLPCLRAAQAQWGACVHAGLPPPGTGEMPPAANCTLPSQCTMETASAPRISPKGKIKNTGSNTAISLQPGRLYYYSEGFSFSHLPAGFGFVSLVLQFHQQWISSPYIYFNSSLSQLPERNTPLTYSSILFAAPYLFSHLVITASPTTPLQLQLLPGWLAVLVMPEQTAHTEGFLFVCFVCLTHMLQCVKHHLMCTTPALCQIFCIFQQYCVQFTPGWGQKCAWIFAENTYRDSKKTHSVTCLTWKLPWEPLPVSSVIQSSLQEL